MKYDAVEQARNYLLEKTGSAPDIAVIMGSGVSAAEDILEHPTRIHYVTIPNFPLPKVAGHRAQAIFGKAHGMNVLVFEGRVHYYEGTSMDDVTFCTRVIARTGAKTLVLTNAAGAVNTSFVPGQRNADFGSHQSAWRQSTLRTERRPLGPALPRPDRGL